MPAPLHPVWGYFRKDAAGSYYRTDKAHKAAWCKACLSVKVERIREREAMAHSVDWTIERRSIQDVESEVFARHEYDEGFPLCGKPEYMLRHLAACLKADLTARAWAESQLAARSEKGKENTHPHTSSPLTPGRSSVIYVPTLAYPTSPTKRLKVSSSTEELTPYYTHQERVAGIVSTGTSRPSHPVLGDVPFPQYEFEKDVCNLFIAQNWAWHGADNVRWRRFLERWVSGAAPVSSKRLSGPILDARVAEVEERIKPLVAGKLGTGQCDGWKDVSKTSVISSLVTVESEPYLIATHDVSSVPKNAETLLELVIADIEHSRTVLNINIIGWCSDAGGDAAKMRRLLKAKQPWLIVVDCWAHQMNLVVGDYFKLKLEFGDAVDMAIELIKWINNHSIALGRLRTLQKMERVVVLILILPVLTRWTTHFLAVRRLLLLRQYISGMVTTSWNTLMDAAGKTKEGKVKAMAVLAYVTDDVFWHRIERAQVHLQPLAVATNILQGSGTRLDHVVLTLGFLYKLYSDPKIEDSVRVGILKSLDKRWTKNADRDVFLFPVLMNPYIRTRVFRRGNPALVPMALLDLASRVHTRLFKRAPDTDFCAAFWDYLDEKKEFSADRMNLVLFEAQYQEELKANIPGATINIAGIWAKLDTSQHTGRNSLIKTAIHALNVTPNSTGAERGFSHMGLVHTKLRNRLGSDKVHKTVVVKTDMIRADRESEDPGLSRKRKLQEEIDATFPPLSSTSGTGTASTRTGLTTAAAVASTAAPELTTVRVMDVSTSTSSSVLSGTGTTAAPAPGPASAPESASNEVSGTALAADSTTSPPSPPGSFAAVVHDLIAETELCAQEAAAAAASNTDASDTPLPESTPVSKGTDLLSSLLPPPPEAVISEEDAFLLRNIFDFESKYLGWAWPRGSTRLEAESELAEQTTAEITRPLVAEIEASEL